MERNLILVAGYPKSGSTWVRLVFQALMNGAGAVSLNELAGGYYGGRRRMFFDEIVPVNSADLLADEIDDLQPAMFRTLARAPGGPHVVKVHDALVRTRSGGWIYPPDTVRAAIYLVRHPFDVAVSYAHHLGMSVAQSVDHMGQDDTVAVSRMRLRLPLHEHLDSWSGNVTSWIDAKEHRVVPVRYEDLYADPMPAFAAMAAASGLPATPAAVAAACDAARFERLKEQERAGGFSERPRTSPVFFRTGRPRSWDGLLDEGLRAQIVADHGAVMARLGYDGEGNATPMSAGPSATIH